MTLAFLNTRLKLIVAITRVFIDRFGAAAIPSILESIPLLRHKHIVPSSSSTTVATTTIAQRGDQRPVGEDDELFSSEELLPGQDDDSRDVPYRTVDYFQRPGMINNHINYNKYNSIFMSATSLRHHRKNEEEFRASEYSSYNRRGRFFREFCSIIWKRFTTI